MKRDAQLSGVIDCGILRQDLLHIRTLWHQTRPESNQTATVGDTSGCFTTRLKLLLQLICHVSFGDGFIRKQAANFP